MAKQYMLIRSYFAVRTHVFGPNVSVSEIAVLSVYLSKGPKAYGADKNILAEVWENTFQIRQMRLEQLCKEGSVCHARETFVPKTT